MTPDHREILARLEDLCLGLDLPDHARYRRCFAAEVEVRNPHFSGPPRRHTGDEWATSVVRTQARFTSCAHILTPASIEFRGDEAHVVVHQRARFVLGGEGAYEVSGPLRLGFRRTAEGWRIGRLEFEVTWSEGDRAVYERARSGVLRGDDGVARYLDRPASLTEMLRATVERTPEAEAVVEVGGERLTYRELWDRAAKVAGGLAEAGVRSGDRVALRLPNGAEWCLAFFGAQLAGAVAVPVNTRLAPPEVEHIMNDSAAAHVIEPGGLPAGRPYAHEGSGDIAAIFYSSGTTGRPKGALTTHANFLSNTESARRVLGMSDVRPWRGLVSVPLYHVTGCNSQFLPACEIGGTTVILRQFEARAFLEALTGERITALMSVPAVYGLLARQPGLGAVTSDVGSLTYGGAPMPPALVTEVRKAFPNARLGSGYGLTETASFVTYLPDEEVEARPQSVGLPVPVVDLALREPGPDGVGELLVRGPNVVPGYWRDEAATREAFDAGWLRTGDLARIDAEGFVEIVDRAKDVVIRGGENVYSAEVERALNGHPDVLEAAVVGVPDRIAGEKVAAAIVVAPGAEVDVRAVFRHARAHLARYKVPELVEVRTAPLPRNPGGKVLKPRIKQSAKWRVAPR